MRLSIAIADTEALASAFVVYRGFEKSIPKVAALGFHGVELALRRADEVKTGWLENMLDGHGLEVSCISTGQVYADGGLMLTQGNKLKRDDVVKIFKDLIDLAAQFGKLINIGRVRGQIGKRSRTYTENLFIETVKGLCDYAGAKDVTLMIEPVNRYEIDFINTVEEGVDLLKKIERKNIMVMPDVFHMNIEDKTIGPELALNIKNIRYIHLADSNRQAPGQGHLDFKDIFEHLRQAGYDGWVSAEILPVPDPDTAAARAAEYLLPFVERHNNNI